MEKYKTFIRNFTSLSEKYKTFIRLGHPDNPVCLTCAI